MHIYDRETHVGTIGAVTASRGGHTVHLDRFVPSATPMWPSLATRSLVLVEVVAFLTEQFAAVQTIRVCLSSPVERRDDVLKVARERARLLQRIGADPINIIPNLESSSRGNFTVSGVWKLDPQSLEVFNAALCDEREMHRRRKAAAATVRGRLARLGQQVRRLLSGSAKKGI
ncbi:hypothetical protein WKW77_27840 [Variovorax ureilyticus]|uniref:Uncharacterized protein n=1 Tax=Variovorax ureilyticus TaxID=1836198 RepID=A0ABU8VMV9_9BURK